MPRITKKAPAVTAHLVVDLAAPRSTSHLDSYFQTKQENETMSKLKFEITTSLDGYVAGRDPRDDQPLGEGGERLH